MSESTSIKGVSTPRLDGLSDELSRFRQSTIQRNYTYLARFLDTDLDELIAPSQILGINLPFPAFQKGVIGNLFYPMSYAKQEHDGYEIRMIILETAFGDGRTLIGKLSEKIRKTNGLYNAPNDQKILGVSLNVLDTAGRISDRYVYQNMLFLGAEEMLFTYEGNEAVRYNITFQCDDIKRIGAPTGEEITL